MPDIWSYCGDCQRWYYCARDASSACPVCEAEPSASEDRAVPPPANVPARLAGSIQA